MVRGLGIRKRSNKRYVDGPELGNPKITKDRVETQLDE